MLYKLNLLLCRKIELRYPNPSHRWVLDRSSHRDPTREQRQQRLTLIGDIRITLESLPHRLDDLEQFGLKRVLSG